MFKIKSILIVFFPRDSFLKKGSNTTFLLYILQLFFKKVDVIILALLIYQCYAIYQGFFYIKFITGSENM